MRDWDDDDKGFSRKHGGSSDVHPALLHDGRHSLLVLTLVLLIQLCGLAVRGAVGVGLVQQRLETENQNISVLKTLPIHSEIIVQL